MLVFDGGIGSISQRQITGSVRALQDGQPQPVAVVLHFQTLGHFVADQTWALPDGAIGFCFTLPPTFQQIPWDTFLQEFAAVAASCKPPAPLEWWILPLNKSVLAGINETTLKAPHLRAYGRAPKAAGKIAVFTIAYNEHTILPLWARYYASQFGAAHTYVIDQGSDRPYDAELPPGMTVIRLPREEFDNWLIMRIVAMFQRFLLESYDTVVYTDSDEFLCASPDALAGRQLPAFLLQIAPPVGMPRGYNLHHDILTEAAYDPSRPVLAQRRVIRRDRAMDKPLIARQPLTWIPGFHAAHEGGTQIPGLFLLHLRFFDLNTALIKGGHYRASKWSPFDLQHHLGHHQLVDDAGVFAGFHHQAQSFAALEGHAFDAEADLSVVPEWMREAIFI